MFSSKEMRINREYCFAECNEANVVDDVERKDNVTNR